MDGLKCLSDNSQGEDKDLAIKYLSLTEKCSNNFESCYYQKNLFGLELEFSGCTCPVQYITWIDQLNMDLGVCHKLSKFDYDIIKDEVVKRNEDLKKLLPMVTFCGFGSKKSSFPSYERQISQELKRIRVGFTHDICTCTTDKCDASSAPNKIMVTSKPPEESSDHDQTHELSGSKTTNNKDDATKFTTEHEHITHTPMKGNETSASPKVQNSDMPPNNQPNNDANNLPDKDKESVTTMSGANRIVNYVSFYCIILAEVIIRRIVNDFF